MINGVVVGCDACQEWMLPWWYENYTKHNAYPVVVADFGMSGRYGLDSIKIPTIPGVKVWFNKPVAIREAPFDCTVWIDIDCEIRGDIGRIFEYARKGFAVTRDPYAAKRCLNTDPIASGVVGVTNNNQILDKWIDTTMAQCSRFRGDQEILNSFVNASSPGVVVMPPVYQWLRLDGDNPEALIMHWTGPTGKDIIRSKIAGR